MPAPGTPTPRPVNRSQSPASQLALPARRQLERGAVPPFWARSEQWWERASGPDIKAAAKAAGYLHPHDFVRDHCPFVARG